MKRVANSGESEAAAAVPQMPLCASCDRCRSRKTKCDGERPCSNCAQKYMKRHKVKSIDGVPYSEFECVYSPAKRRGPVPGKSTDSRKVKSLQGSIRGASGGARTSYDSYGQQQPAIDDVGLRHLMLAQQQQQTPAFDQGWGGGLYDSAGLGGGMASQQQALQQQLDQLNYLTQQQALAQQQTSLPGGQNLEQDQPAAQRIRMDPGKESANYRLVADTVAGNMRLLSRNDIDGNRLRAYYRLSIDELFALPTIPTDEEFFSRLNLPVPRIMPKGLHNALLAAQFSELALGALVHNEVQLAMELCNATVHCLRKCVEEPVEQSYLFEVSRAYFLLGVFRAFRGDTDRYLKYRRVCMTHLSQLQDEESPVVGCDALLAAIAYLDAWAYMMHNANESALPSIDDTIPPVVQNSNIPTNSTQEKYDVMTTPACIAADPKNQVWIQGAPPVYLNNEAPLPARSLDALACAIRSCCDQANSRFKSMEKDAKPSPDDEAGSSDDQKTSSTAFISPTATAVMSHKDELCARNMVLSAFTLLQQHEASTSSPQKNQGQHLIISAMDAFLENGDEDGSGSFTDSQIQSLINVCNTVIENPLLLHHGGPTYHMVSNAAILLCHLLNGMYASKGNGKNEEMESAVFEEILDTFVSVRKLLNIHRRKLPVKLRCHGIPRPSVTGPIPGRAFIDLGETLMCACRGCQGFVLMACSPCVAAERARAAGRMQDMEAVREAERAEAEELDKEILDLGAEFDLDDDALLNMLSRIITA